MNCKIKIFICLIIFNVGLHFRNISAALNQYNLKMSLDLVKELGMRQCILLQNERKEELAYEFKKFSSEYIPIIHFNYSSLTEYIRDTKTVYPRTGIILKKESLKILKDILSRLRKTGETYKLRNFVWLMFLNDGTEILQNFELNIPYDCEFMVIQPTNKTAYKLTEIYTVRNKLFSVNFGTWNRDYGLKSTNTTFYLRRINFQNTEIYGYRYSDIGFEGEPVIIYISDIISGLVGMTNLTYRERAVKYAHVSEEGYGDIKCAPSHFSFYNNKWKDTLGPILESKMNWYIKYPRVELRSDYYQMPFNNQIWLVLFFVILIGTLCILTTQNLIRDEKRSLIDNLFLGLESFCNQCGNDDIQNIYSRCVCISLRLTAFLLIGGLYGAIVTSFFVVEIFQPPFKNRDEFLANGEYRLILEEDTAEALISWTLQFSDRDTQKIFMDYSELIDNHYHHQSIEKICYGKYVVYDYDDDINHKYNRKWPCRIYKIPEYLGTVLIGLSLVKNSPFTKIFGKNLIRFRENGIQMLWRVKILLAPASTAEEPDFIQPIKIEQMTQVLSIPIIGILLGVAIIVIEFIHDKHRFLQPGAVSRQNIKHLIRRKRTNSEKKMGLCKIHVMAHPSIQEAVQSFRERNKK